MARVDTVSRPRAPVRGELMPLADAMQMPLSDVDPGEKLAWVRHDNFVVRERGLCLALSSRAVVIATPISARRLPAPFWSA